MALRQAIQIKNLYKAIDDDLPIVLLSPKNEQTSLSRVFDKTSENKTVTAENAHMTKLSEWAKPPRKNGKIYGHIETTDWNDFEDKLNHIFKKGNITKLSIEYEGYITNIHNASLTRDSAETLTNALQNDEGGTSLYSSPDLKVSFLKLAFDKEKNLTVSLPYLNANDDDLKRVYLHTPDMKDDDFKREYHDHFDHVNLA